jgi:DNA-binding CsgD family transcriptional regulator
MHSATALTDWTYAMLDSVLCALPQRVYAVDGQDRFVYVNAAGAQAIGAGRSEIAGKTLTEIQGRPRGNAELFERVVRSVFETGRRTHKRLASPLPTGIVDVDLTLTPVFEEDGSTVKLVVVVSSDLPLPAGLQGPDAVGPEVAVLNELSMRRRQVLVLLARGYSNRQVADELQISIRTVETHRRDIAEALGLSTRADFFRYAKDCGYV